VISLESYHDPSGRGGAVKVHRLHKVNREDVILPQKTLDLLDRNVGKFVSARDQIKSFGFSAKKGLLVHGPPGTAKRTRFTTWRRNCRSTRRSSSPRNKSPSSVNTSGSRGSCSRR